MDRLISEQEVIESIEFYQMNPQHFDFVNLIDDIKEIPSAEPKVGRCEDCKYFRKLPLRTDTSIGKCIQHWGVCPPCDWYCADFEPQESEG